MEEVVKGASAIVTTGQVLAVVLVVTGWKENRTMTGGGWRRRRCGTQAATIAAWQYFLKH